MTHRLDEGFFKSAIESSLDCVRVLDPEGRIVEWNASATRIFGWSEQEALGKLVVVLLVPPGSREAIFDVFRALVARRGRQVDSGAGVKRIPPRPRDSCAHRPSG